MKIIREQCDKIPVKRRWYHPARDMKVSELDELLELDDSDYLLISDISEKKSVKISLKTLKRFIKS